MPEKGRRDHENGPFHHNPNASVFGAACNIIKTAPEVSTHENTPSAIDSWGLLCIIERIMDRITQKTRIDQLIAAYPGLSRTFIRFGLPCLVCGEPFWGTIEELARLHAVEVMELVNKLNDEMREFDVKT